MWVDLYDKLGVFALGSDSRVVQGVLERMNPESDTALFIFGINRAHVIDFDSDAESKI